MRFQITLHLIQSNVLKIANLYFFFFSYLYLAYDWSRKCIMFYIGLVWFSLIKIIEVYKEEVLIYMIFSKTLSYKFDV
ncbi:hypothetical protein J3Q64DRAFT_1752919 [Phycomyces blakesleeanus]|uniref:Uncharacterized protein n=1 Tax=Phycomyces blakesleeanus TaxID=4837 RepID=A0ABR3AX22_PHYBL